MAGFARIVKTEESCSSTFATTRPMVPCSIRDGVLAGADSIVRTLPAYPYGIPHGHLDAIGKSKDGTRHSNALGFLRSMMLAVGNGKVDNPTIEAPKRNRVP